MTITDKEFFGDDKGHDILITAEDGVAKGEGIVLEYPKLEELTKEQIDAVEQYVQRIFDSGCIVPWDVCLLYGKIVSFGIMDTTNNHDPALVKKINLHWVKNHKMFGPILAALYIRDHEKMYAMSEDVIGDLPDETVGGPEDNWKEYAHNYLMHVADNQDLETILSTVRTDKG